MGSHEGERERRTHTHTHTSGDAEGGDVVSRVDQGEGLHVVEVPHWLSHSLHRDVCECVRV